MVLSCFMRVSSITAFWYFGVLVQCLHHMANIQDFMMVVLAFDGHQICIEASLLFPLPQQVGRENTMKKLMHRDKSRENSHQLPL